jgi:hypothetical protein
MLLFSYFGLAQFNIQACVVIDAVNGRGLALLLSIVIFLGKPSRLMARSR